MPALFIDVKLAPSLRADPELAKRLEEVCPVSIFAATPQGVAIREENLDECTLCDLCLAVAPKGSLEIVKLYAS